MFHASLVANLFLHRLAMRDQVATVVVMPQVVTALAQVMRVLMVVLVAWMVSLVSLMVA